MRRNNIDIYWAKIDKASEGAIAQVRVTDDGSGSDFCCRSHASSRRKGGSMLFRAADWRFARLLEAVCRDHFQGPDGRATQKARLAFR